MMAWTMRYPMRLIDLAARRLRGDVLAGPLGPASDGQIDAALKERGLARADLFRPSQVVARHRRRLAWMLATWRIDVERAAEEHWQELKVADARCGRCRNAGRCMRWLEWGQLNAAPMSFCPNASLWSAIASEQGVEGAPILRTSAAYRGSAPFFGSGESASVSSAGGRRERDSKVIEGASKDSRHRWRRPRRLLKWNAGT